MIAVGGGGSPVRNARRKAPCGIVGGLPVTVKLTETAAAPAATPQIPATVQFRDWELVKIPPWIGAPFPRVSATRQGLIAMKGSGLLADIVPMPSARGGDQVGGADQFGMSSANVTRENPPAATRRKRIRNENVRGTLIKVLLSGRIDPGNHRGLTCLERTIEDLVGAAGIEPATICSQSRYATAALRPGERKLSHARRAIPVRRRQP